MKPKLSACTRAKMQAAAKARWAKVRNKALDAGMAVQKIDKAQQAIEQSQTVSEVMEARSQVAAIQTYLRTHKVNHLQQNRHAALKLRADRRLGELIPIEFPKVHAGPGRKKTGRTERPVLADLGISKSLSSRCQAIARIPVNDFEDRLAIGNDEIVKELTMAMFLLMGKLSEKKANRTSKRKATEAASAFVASRLSEVCDMRCCSFEELLSSCTPDAVITDPPYPKEFLPLYGKLAEACRSVPLVAVMCGHSYLPDIMASMTKHLEYRWMMAYLTPGGQAVQVWNRKVNTFWKPVLLFGEALDWIGDVVSSDVNDNDKDFHRWGQSESGIASIVDRLTKPGSLVCDPFIGGGTTAVVSLRLGRRFVGCDIDQAAVDTAKKRVNEAFT